MRAVISVVLLLLTLVSYETYPVCSLFVMLGAGLLLGSFFEDNEHEVRNLQTESTRRIGHLISKIRYLERTFVPDIEITYHLTNGKKNKSIVLSESFKEWHERYHGVPIASYVETMAADEIIQTRQMSDGGVFVDKVTTRLIPKPRKKL